MVLYFEKRIEDDKRPMILNKLTYSKLNFLPIKNE